MNEWTDGHLQLVSTLCFGVVATVIALGIWVMLSNSNTPKIILAIVGGLIVISPIIYLGYLMIGEYKIGGTVFFIGAALFIVYMLNFALHHYDGPNGGWKMK